MAPKNPHGQNKSHIKAWAFVGLLLPIITLNATGFCWHRMRWLTDKELIEYAIAHELRDPDRIGSYPSIEVFLAQNEKCCVVDRYPDSSRLPGFALSMIGFRTALVELFYRQDVKYPHETPYYDVFMGVGCCGDIGAWWGTDAKENERPRDAQSWR